MGGAIRPPPICRDQARTYLYACLPRTDCHPWRTPPSRKHRPQRRCLRLIPQRNRRPCRTPLHPYFGTYPAHLFRWIPRDWFHEGCPGTGNEFVGDFRNGYIDLGWDNFDEEEKLSKRAIELNNGRAAMAGILGLMVPEKIVPLGYGPDLPIIGHLS